MTFEEVAAGAGVPPEIEALTRTSFDCDGDDAADCRRWSGPDAPAPRAFVWSPARASGSPGLSWAALSAPPGSSICWRWRRNYGVAASAASSSSPMGIPRGGTRRPRPLHRREPPCLCLAGRRHSLHPGDRDIPPRRLHAPQRAVQHGCRPGGEVKHPKAAELRRVEEAGVTVRRATRGRRCLARHTAKQWTEVWARRPRSRCTGRRLRSFLPRGRRRDRLCRPTAYCGRNTLRSRSARSPKWRRIGLGGILTRLALLTWPRRRPIRRNRLGRPGLQSRSTPALPMRVSVGRSGR